MISYSTDPPDPNAYLRLFETTGWNDIYSQTAGALWATLRASWFVVFARCDEAEIRDVLLFAATGTPEFYAGHGFEPRPRTAPGMIRRRPCG